MTRNEFQRLLTYLTSGYPAVHSFLAGSPGATEIWWDVLKDCDAQDCREVVAEMFRGAREVPAYSQLPAVIRKGSRDLTFERRKSDVDGLVFAREQTFICVKCLDSGLITVANPRQQVHQLRDPPVNWEEIPDDQWAIPVWTCAVACDECELGERWANARWSKSGRGPMVKFDEQRMCRIDPAWNGKQRFSALQEFWSNYVDPRRYSEFDQWNAQTEFVVE